jgi:hypothetical protein
VANDHAQEQTCNTLAESDPELAGVVLSAMELATDFTVGDATTMSRWEAMRSELTIQVFIPGWLSICAVCDEHDGMAG